MLKVAELRATLLQVRNQVDRLNDNVAKEEIATRARWEAMSSDTTATQASFTSL